MGKNTNRYKVVLVIGGQSSGREAFLIKNYDYGTSHNFLGHTVVAGIDRHPQKIHKPINEVTMHER